MRIRNASREDRGVLSGAFRTPPSPLGWSRRHSVLFCSFLLLKANINPTIVMAVSEKDKDERATILAEQALGLVASGQSEVEVVLPSNADDSH